MHSFESYLPQQGCVMPFHWIPLWFSFKKQTQVSSPVSIFPRNTSLSRLKCCKCSKATDFLVYLFSSVNILWTPSPLPLPWTNFWIPQLLHNCHQISFTDGVNVIQFICCYQAATMNDLIDLLNVLWNHCNPWLAALLFIRIFQLHYCNESTNWADIHCWIAIHIFQSFMNVNGHLFFHIQEFNHRTQSNIYVSHFANRCSAITCWLKKLLLHRIGEEDPRKIEINIFHISKLFKNQK